jgi:hypothetical protein
MYISAIRIVSMFAGSGKAADMPFKLSNLIGESHQNFASVFVALSPFGTPNLHGGSRATGRR